MTAYFHWAGESEAADVVARERALLSGMGSGKIEPIPWMVCSAFRSEFVAAGAYQRHASALNLDACALKKTPVVARLTGGISVRWGPGVLHVALILPNASAWTETPMDRIINRYVRGMLTALASMGFEAAYHGKEFLYANPVRGPRGRSDPLIRSWDSESASRSEPMDRRASNGANGKHVGSLGFEIAPGGAVLIECALALSGRWAMPQDVLGYPADASYLTGGFPHATLQELGWKDPSPEALSRLIVSGFESRFGVSFEDAASAVLRSCFDGAQHERERPLTLSPSIDSGPHEVLSLSKGLSKGGGGMGDANAASTAVVGRSQARASIGFVEALVAVEGARIGHVELYGDFLADSEGVRTLTGELIGRTFSMEEVTATIRSVFDQRQHVLLGVRPEELGSLIVRAGEDAQRAAIVR